MSELVLVLNANFEPINVCEMRRAVGLLLCDKASLILDGRGYITSALNKFPRPSIIRLKNQIVRPHPEVKLTRREVFRRDSYTCQYCGKKASNLTIDHVLPRHLGGAQTWCNVVTACSSCNHRKGGRTLRDANMHLLHPPKEPPHSATYIFGRHLSECEDWEPFLKGW
jgi:5-methylcytosine-specific restriction endonuclease McrA